MSKKENEALIPKNLFNPSLNRQLLDQNNCPWDELDYSHLKICILKEGTSPAALSNIFHGVLGRILKERSNQMKSKHLLLK